MLEQQKKNIPKTPKNDKHLILIENVQGHFTEQILGMKDSEYE